MWTFQATTASGRRGHRRLWYHSPSCLPPPSQTQCGPPTIWLCDTLPPKVQGRRLPDLLDDIWSRPCQLCSCLAWCGGPCVGVRRGRQSPCARSATHPAVRCGLTALYKRRCHNVAQARRCGSAVNLREWLTMPTKWRPSRQPLGARGPAILSQLQAWCSKTALPRRRPSV